MSQPLPPDGQEPTTGQAREDAAQQTADEVAAIMAGVTVAIIGLVAVSVLAVAGTAGGWQAIRRKMLKHAASIFGQASGKLKTVYASAAKRAGGGGDLPDAPQQIAKAILTAHQNAGEMFDAAMQAALGMKGLPVPPTPGPYRQIVEQAMRDRAGIGANVAGLSGTARAQQGLSQLQVTQRIMDDIAARGLTGYVDSRGRRWELGAYAEMAVRTAQSRMALRQQLAKMAAAGNTLVIVDNPSMEAACKKCRPWEGRVLSLTDQSSGPASITDAHGVRRTEQVAGTLSTAVAAGLLHPNCRHSLIPWADGEGAVATAGGARRGYVVGGRSVSRALPVGTPQKYEDEQKLRVHEREVRGWQARVAASITPQGHGAAELGLARSSRLLRQHVRKTRVTRLPHRERHPRHAR